MFASERERRRFGRRMTVWRLTLGTPDDALGDAVLWASHLAVRRLPHACPRGMDRDDLVQETAIRVLRGIVRWRRARCPELRAFACLLARRALIDVLRTSRVPRARPRDAFEAPRVISLDRMRRAS